MAEGKVQEAALAPPPPTQGELPLPPPKEAFSKFYQQRQANELRRLYRHIHPELRKNLEEAVAEDLAEALGAEEPTEGDVQSMRWIFENWSLDAIGDHPPPQRLADSEAVPGGDVRATSRKFEDGSFCGSDQAPAKPEPVQGDVRTVRWLFETQPMDALTSPTDIQKAVLREPPPGGDVRGTRTLFETRPLDSLGRAASAQEQSPLQLRSEIQELKGDVKTTVKLFQTEPLCAIRDAEGGIHEVRAACREEIQSTAVRTARWLFETKPLDAINRDPSQVRVIRGISLEEAARPDISNTRWLFETQPLDAIREVTIDEKDFQPSPDLVPPGPDVQQQRMLFETRALDTLKGEDASREDAAAKEAVIGGDVRSTLWLFETRALETPSREFQVGRLQQVRQLEDGRDSEGTGLQGAPKLALGQCPAEDGEVKGDVKAFKKLFETLPLDSIGQEKPAGPAEERKPREGASAGQVQAGQALFENWPLYAIQDGQGGLHALTSVSREQVVGGDVQGSRWMFETQPLDRLGRSPERVDVIRGVTRQEVVAGNVSSARWLFETQPLEVIHRQQQEKEGKEEEPPAAAPPKCNVQTIRWLFETRPIHALAQDSAPEVTGAGPHSDIRSYTWMFESQPREGPGGPGERHLQVRQASPPTPDQHMEAHVFETEPPLPAHALGGKDPVHYCSRVEIPIGQVSRRKEAFEGPLGAGGRREEPAAQPAPGNSVRKFTWLFENCPMDCLQAETGGIQELPPEKGAAAAAASGKRFVFETGSLGELPDDVDESELLRIEKKAPEGGPGASQTLRFESQPLYVLPDRQGRLHEVTAVRKEEVQKADSRGARWVFETRPLTQSLGVGEEVFVIRAVTQEDISQGERRAARWKFETEPLEPTRPRPLEAAGQPAGRYVRTVSVSDVQQGSVRTSTWLFENRPLDSLKGPAEPAATPEPGPAVQRQDSRRGDVKRCTWLFETQPLDQLREPADPEEAPPEELPRADVKSTTWLFESTPLDQLRDPAPPEERPREQVPPADVKGTTRLFESKPLDRADAKKAGGPEEREAAAGETLRRLHSGPGVLQGGGILIEAHTARTVRMAKYQLPGPGREPPRVQKEELVLGELPRILRRVTQGPDMDPQGLLVREDEAGLMKPEPLTLSALADGGHEVWDLLAWSWAPSGIRTGMVIQETEGGLVKLLVYSLRLRPGTQPTCRAAERGSVQLLASCIEKGDLSSLKSLQWEPPTESPGLAEGTSTPGRTPATASSEKVIHVALPDGGLECPRATGATSTNLLSKEAWAEPGEPQKTPVTAGEPRGAPSGGVPGPDLQVAMQNLRQATAEAQNLQHQMQSKQKPKAVPPAREPLHNGQPPEPGPPGSPAPGISRAPMPSVLVTPGVRSKVSASQEVPVEGSLRGRVAIQDGIYSAKAVSTFMPLAGPSPAKGELEARPQPGTFLLGAPTPPKAGGLETGSGAEGEGPRGCVQAALQSLGKARMNVSKGDIRAALIYQDAARRVCGPTPSPAAGPQALNAFPPPPAAVTGAQLPPLAGPEDDALSCAAAPQKSRAHLPGPAPGQRPPERAETALQKPHAHLPGPAPGQRPPERAETAAETAPQKPRAHLPGPAPGQRPPERAETALQKPHAHLPGSAPGQRPPERAETAAETAPPKPRAHLPGPAPGQRPPERAETALQKPHAYLPGPAPGQRPPERAETAAETVPQKPRAHLPGPAPGQRPPERAEMEVLISRKKPTLPPKPAHLTGPAHGLAPKYPALPISPVEAPSLSPPRQTSGSPNGLLAGPGLVTSQASEKQAGGSGVQAPAMRSPRILMPSEEDRAPLRGPRGPPGQEPQAEAEAGPQKAQEEIPQGHVQEARDIFENLKKQQELQAILSQVKAMEEEAVSGVDVKALQSLFEAVPEWVGKRPQASEPREAGPGQASPAGPKEVSSVELAFGDLARASAEVACLKEQTLARLLDIEKAIRKALSSVSSLKPEADIPPLASLLPDSLREGSLSPAPRESGAVVSVPSGSKARSGQPGPEGGEQAGVGGPAKAQDLWKMENQAAVRAQPPGWSENRKAELGPRVLPSRGSSPSSPSFISIQSAARKPAEPPSPRDSPDISRLSRDIVHSLPRRPPAVAQEPLEAMAVDRGHGEPEPSPAASPLFPRRQKSVLELQTGPQGSQLYGATHTVTEQYEEVDPFGNKIITSSTTVTKQADGPAGGGHGASPLLRRYLHNASRANGTLQEAGMVCVTFGNSQLSGK